VIERETIPRPRSAASRAHALPRRRYPPRPLCLALLCLSSSAGLAALLQAKEKPPTTYTIAVPPKPDFSDLDWLIGEWTGKTEGRDSAGQVHFSAAYEFDKRLLILREEIAFPATKTTPATKESWMGVLTGRGSDGSFVMRSYSSTGFITRFGVTVDGGLVSFNQQGGEQSPPGWLFRRIFEHTNPAVFVETVRVAPPERPFFDYYSAKLTRIAPAATPASPPETKAAASPAKPPKQ
jgi:hypothetical protein